MSRRRSKNLHLPPRLRRKGNAYYYDTGSAGKRVYGKRRYISLGLDYAQALRKWAELEGQPQQGSTMIDALDRFLVEVVPQKASATQREYLREMERLRAVFGQMALSDVKPPHVAQYLDQHPRKTLANREIALLSSVYSYAMRWGWCERNPCTGVKRNKEQKRTRYLRDEELRALRKVASDQMRCIVDVAYLTGLRKKDILKIRLSDITKEGLYVEHSKTGKRVVFELTAGLAEVITRARGLRRRVGSLYLFANRRGQAYTTSGFDCLWKGVVKRSGLQDVRFHDLRAKAASDAPNATELLGHLDPRTTERYMRKPAQVRPLDKEL